MRADKVNGNTSRGLKNPKGKTRWHLLNSLWPEAEACVKVIEHGADKYQENNWQQNVKEQPKYYKSAIMRHLTSYLSGERIDPDSKLHHLAHVAVNAWFLMWGERNE